MVRLPRDGQGCRDKTRRILLLPEQSSVLCASHHGFLERFDATPLRRRSVVQLPPAPTHAFVEDACIVSLSSGPHVILGHARDEQEISVVPLSGRREATSMSRIPHGGVKGGTSTVCAMSQPCMFASGGHDHSVHLWKIVEDWNAENDLRGSARRLAIKHVSVVQSLLPLLDTSHKLVSASADCSVQLYDLASERAVNTVRTSNSPFHVHNAPMPFCVLLEVGHRETQFELRDYRLVPERPVARFGYPTEKIQGRFVKGDLQENLFACGDTEGTVRVWDIRASSRVLSSVRVPALSSFCLFRY
ncbi:hypothetical protein OF83DRAFT_1053467 [Amylostereum chailletii]|nr:hypothetical protein OF83DRAFT_1053467 [Amylostereum chailletii]